MSILQEAAISKRPYVGPRPFTRKDEAYFFGRERELRELVSLIFAHPAVLFYAPSGAGKTSLLQAKVTGQLATLGMEVLGTARVRGAVPESPVLNVFLYNTLSSLAGSPLKAEAGAGGALLAYLEKLQPSKEVAAEAEEEEDLSTQRVLFFDQFEEIFSFHPELWEQRELFFEEIGAALERYPWLHVVFAMREEYIASLDPYSKRLPERLRTRFRLELLRRDRALEAIQEPARKSGRPFTKSAADKLVSNLLQISASSTDGMSVCAGEFVDPLQLQLVCERLWTTLPERNGDESEEIDEEFIQDYGDVDLALEQYYDDCVREIAAERAKALGLDEVGQRTLEAQIRRWFEKELITPGGTRGIIYQGLTKTGDLPNDLVTLLEDRHLVRAEMRGGEKWCELGHDRLIQPLRSSNTKALADADTRNWIEGWASRRFKMRQLSRGLQQPLSSVYRYVAEESTPEEAYADWRLAEHIFCLGILEGSIPLQRRLGSDTFGVLERDWLSDLKLTKAYLLWEERTRNQGADRDDYLDACCIFREKMMTDVLKGSPQDFEAIDLFLRARYLDGAGRFDPEKAEAAVQAKAHRLYLAGAGRGAQADWDDALAYARMFYDHVVPAVRDRSEECTLIALKAFQSAPLPGDRYRLVSAFEAAVAIYFFSPTVVRKHWQRTQPQPVPESYPESRVDVEGFLAPHDLPSSLQYRLAFDAHSRKLVLRGALTEEERSFLSRYVPAATLDELVRQSRLLTEGSTL